MKIAFLFTLVGNKWDDWHQANTLMIEKSKRGWAVGAAYRWIQETGPNMRNRAIFGQPAVSHG